ncbi:MAG TPA: type II secretion system F family protein [Symbiobacteriaceae bacterium]|nr:type II secretion system F family protein [Symbiobacteriaceae bacterium]
MGVWVYKLRDATGQVSTGKVEAETERDAITRLRSQGMVLGLEADRDLQAMLKRSEGLFQPRVSGKDLAVFSRQFSTMVNAGLPVVTALKVLSGQSTNPRLGKALQMVAVDVESGESLASAFARQGALFPPIMIHLLDAGEVGGILDEVTARLATQLEKDELVRQKVKSALVYPSIVSVVAVCIVIFLMTFVVPKFVGVYEDLGAELPWLTQALIAVSHVVQKTWWLLIGGGVLAAFGLRRWIQTESGGLFWDRLLLKLPVFGILLTKQAIARFARTLGSLLNSGIPILKAMAVVERVVGNRVISHAVRGALDEIRQGATLSTPLRKERLFPPMVMEMVAVGEETGTMELMLSKVADFFEEDVQRSAERLSAALEPLIIVFLAISVGLIVISMMLPIFGLWSAIG